MDDSRKTKMITQRLVRFIVTVVVVIVVVVTTVTVILVTVDSTPPVVAEEGSTSSSASTSSSDHRRLKEQKPTTTKALSSVEPLVLNDYHNKNRQRPNQYGRVYTSKSSLEVCTFTPPAKNSNQNKDLFVYQGGLSRDDGRSNSDTNNIEGNNDNQRSLNSKFLGGPQGFIYVKVPKSASSTLAAVNIRLARGVTERFQNTSTQQQDQQQQQKQSQYCISFQNHIVGAGYHYGNRDRSKSFLWGSVREPASRSLSRVYFQLSRGNSTDINDNEVVLEALKNGYHPQTGTVGPKGKGGFQLQYLTLQDKSRPIPDWYFYNKQQPTAVQEPRRLEVVVQRVINDYDFIAVSERMDESLVVLQYLLNLALSDVLVSSSKVGGGINNYSYNAKHKVCLPLQKPKTFTNVVEEYTTSDEWYAINYGDYLLYDAANDSLDLTISYIVETVGRDRFDKALESLRNAHRLVSKECSGRTYTQCSSSGEVQLEKSLGDCYTEDSGCGYRCIDEISQREGWGRSYI